MKRGILLLALALVSPLEGQERPWMELPIQAHTLENGMRLFILPRPGVPIASFVVQYRIGSVDETPGSTGIAHLLEHLLFKGTTTVGTRDFETEAPLLERMDLLFDSLLLEEGKTVPDTARLSSFRAEIGSLEERAARVVVSNEFDAILSENGARGLNASTTLESTTYYVELPANRAELWFVLEADRMRNPVFREFYTERDVVAEERRSRVDASPGGLLYEAHMAAAFQMHPYGRPVIGTMDDLQRLTRPQVEDYFRRFYAPANAVVAVVGDVDPDQILHWARRYLGSVPPGTEPPPLRVREPEQRGERRVEVVFDAEPALRIGWKIPASHHEDAPALAMLASLLTGGRSSRIYRRLVVDDRLASGVTSTAGPGELYPGLFTIDAHPLAPHTTSELEEAIYQELDRLKEAPPDDRELQRVRNQLEAAEVRRLRSNLGLAFQIAGSASLFRDWRESFAALERMREVSPDDIQRVVRRYFVREGRTVATLVKPAPGGGTLP